MQSLTFIVEGERVDALSDALLAAGAASVDVADAYGGTPLEQAAYGEPGAQVQPWPHARVRALFALDADPRQALAVACEAIAMPLPTDAVQSVVEDQDWVRLTQAQFAPLAIAPRLWIVPSWEAPPDPAALNIVLDPGAAFGTGHHPSTRLCLRWLAQHIRGGERVLDYGCGSGILAIAALKLGAGAARGVDIDPQALVAARANAMQNRIDAEFATPGSESGFDADVVVANILANPLIALAPLLAAATRADGRVVLSGILEDQHGAVAEAYAPWFEMEPVEIEEGWARLCGRRNREAGP